MEGPQFSSKAESELYRGWNCDVIGMTNMPEAKLARDAELCYATVAMVTDFDCWHPEHDHVSVEMIVRTLHENADHARTLVRAVAPRVVQPGATACPHGCQRALEYAHALACPRIHVMAGLVPQDVDAATVRATYSANLRWAAQAAHAAGCDVLIEPINTRDMPGFFLNRQDQAHAIVQEIGAPNLKVQFDLYHCQIVEGDVATKIRHYLPTGRVGHFQIAGVPERHEPDLGELNYRYLLRQPGVRLGRLGGLRVPPPTRHSSERKH